MKITHRKGHKTFAMIPCSVEFYSHDICSIGTHFRKEDMLQVFSGLGLTQSTYSSQGLKISERPARRTKSSTPCKISGQSSVGDSEDLILT